MGRNAFLLAALAVLVIGALLLLPTNEPTTSVSTNEGTRVEAPGTRVETNDDQTRVQAPGVDITVPRDKDGPDDTDGN